MRLAGGGCPGADGDALLEDDCADDASAWVDGSGVGGWDGWGAVSPAEEELVEGREEAAGDRAVLDDALALRGSAVALREAGPVGEVVGGGARVARVVAAGEGVEGRVAVA